MTIAVLPVALMLLGAGIVVAAGLYSVWVTRKIGGLLKACVVAAPIVAWALMSGVARAAVAAVAAAAAIGWMVRAEVAYRRVKTRNAQQLAEIQAAWTGGEVTR